MTQTNDTRRADLMNEVREFGRLNAQGKDSLPMLALKVAYAAASGVISGTKDADGNDDFVHIYAEFAKSESKKAVHEHTVNGVKANTSKLRQVGTAAAMTTCDFVATVNAGIKKREEMLKADAKVKVRSAYPAIVELAREQIAQADDLTADQIEACLAKPDAPDKTLEGEYKRVEKILAALIEGKDGVKDDSVEIVSAHGMIEAKLATFTLAKDTADVLAKMASLGIVAATPVLIPA